MMKAEEFPSSFIIHHSPYLCFFTGVFAGFFAVPGVFSVCALVSAPPSSSERPSSTSTVCVTASVPFTAGCAAAGAIVCVVGAVELTDADFPQRQPAVQSTNVNTINTDGLIALLTDTSWMVTDSMQFP
jgi:hypothetical protein